MSLLALDNTLHRGVMQRRFHADLRIRAVESLLFERIPLTHAVAGERTPAVAPPVRPATAEEPAERIWKEATAVPRVHFYGNGRYCAHGDQLRRRLQPLERSRSHPLALRHHARSMGQLPLHSRHPIGRPLGRDPQTRRQAIWAQAPRTSPPIAPNFTATSSASRPSWK